MRLALTLAALVATGPALAQGHDPLPPFVPAYAPTSVDERGLWRQADEHERSLRDSSAVIRDAALNTYVRRVLCQTVGADRCGSVRLYIVRVPAFNASMSPNGMMELWSGLLLRLRSEAELAAVLAHEFGHFELRHGLAGFKRGRSLSDLAVWSSLLTYPNAAFSQSLIGIHYSYMRGDEVAADMIGMTYLKQAGYRPAAFPRLWQRLMDEQDETALGRRRKVTHRYAAGFFATHPTELVRTTYLAKAAGPDAERGRDEAAAFDAATAVWRPSFLVDQIKLNDFGGSDFLLGQLAGDGWSADLLFARGELYRERGHPRDLVSAADFYRQAIARGCTDPAAWRGLGLSLMRGGQIDTARSALKTYLDRAPDAADRTAMMMLMGEGDGI